MSKLLKSIGKVFRKIVRAVKKFALPILAIGAIVLTGGAALGLTTTTLGGLAGQLGLGAIAPAITAAGQGALFGAVGSAIQGKNILKGATTGLIAGGVTGGLGQAFGAIGKAATTGLPSTANAASNVASNASVTGGAINGVTEASNAARAIQTANGIAGAATDLTSAIPMAGANMTAPTLASSGGGLGGALGGFMKENPLIAGQMISGLGQGLLGYAGAKAQAKQDEKNWKRVADSYTTDGLLEPTGVDYGAGRPTPAQKYQRFGYDPRTGQIVIQEA